jgi:hypothetical protein
MRSDQWTCVFCALAVLSLLFFFARDGLFVSLSEDDLMNLHFAAGESRLRLLVANLFPFTTVYRPAGAALYILLFDFVGFSPIYFRAATCVLLLLGCVAVYRLGSVCDSRVTTGALAAIPLAFHSRLTNIYTENAYVYDVLCGALFASTVAFYVNRRRHGPLRWQNVLILYFLWAATVNAKEIGLTLPVVLMAYELVYCRPFLCRRLVWPAALLALSIASWRSKIALGSPLYNHASYEPSIDLAHLLYETQQQVADAVLAPDVAVSVGLLAVVVATFVGVVLASRSKAAQFGLLWVLITPLPVLAIWSRSFSSMYIPWMGVCIVLGAVTAQATEVLRFPTNWKPLTIPVFAVIWAAVQWHDTTMRGSLRETGAQWEHVRSAIDDYGQLPGLCDAKNVLILGSRFGDDRYHPLFLKELYCGQKDPHVAIPGVNITIEAAREQMTSFDLVIIDDGEELRIHRPSAAERRTRTNTAACPV